MHVEFLFHVAKPRIELGTEPYESFVITVSPYRCLCPVTSALAMALRDRCYSIFCAGEGNRTLVSDLEGQHNRAIIRLPHYFCAVDRIRTDTTWLEVRNAKPLDTTTAFVGKMGFEPTFSSYRYRYRMYKIPLLLTNNSLNNHISLYDQPHDQSGSDPLSII